MLVFFLKNDALAGGQHAGTGPPSSGVFFVVISAKSVGTRVLVFMWVGLIFILFKDDFRMFDVQIDDFFK